jgi:hypothetical protein
LCASAPGDRDSRRGPGWPTVAPGRLLNRFRAPETGKFVSQEINRAG